MLVSSLSKSKSNIANSILLFLCLMSSCKQDVEQRADHPRRPNILIAISDDQSFPHASAYGSKMVNTPAFDRIAHEGILFNNAFVASPGCSPSRAALLTGMNTWQIEEAGTHASSFPLAYMVYPDLLEEAGYFIGYTQKGWAPGNWEASGRKRNPAGNAFSSLVLEPPFDGIVKTDYAANFKKFLDERPEGKPFHFWYGSSEPHRVYEKGSGLASGKKLEQAEVPDYLPDTEEIRADLLDYALEIEWFDLHLSKMIALLEELGELENTIIVVTSDNGMPFSRAKANLYEDGIHVPMAIRWGDQVSGGRIVDDLVSLIDLTPTFLEVAGIGGEVLAVMEGKSLMNILKSDKQGLVDESRNAVYAARERHSSSRWNNLGYSQRGVRTQHFLYVRNFTPDRWPAGDPQEILSDETLGPMHQAYYDIDAAPTQDFLVEHADDEEYGKYLQLSVAKRPTEELFDIRNDPYCLHNLSDNPEFKSDLLEHRQLLGGYLMKTNDPRVTGNGDIFESYPRLRGVIRSFPKPNE
ncbi:sulfatase family protein [Pararhodonellum marinum]|uniref:sulfatase family protein n=1 Tax=Pararhodonellum marinum TaxID=2755358 RepID=UPI00188DEED2|nr:sulfatase [Pararhodonellum marinum]